MNLLGKIADGHAATQFEDSFIRRYFPQNHPEKCCFAAAVPAKKRYMLFIADIHGQVPEKLLFPETL